MLCQELTDLVNELSEQGTIDERESFIDETYADGQREREEEVEPSKRGKGMKILAIVDRHGLPLSVSTHAANHHEVRLVQLSFDFYMIEAKPENLIGDRAYDSDTLDVPLEAGWYRDDHPASLESHHAQDAGRPQASTAARVAGSWNASSPGFQ